LGGFHLLTAPWFVAAMETARTSLDLTIHPSA
jgi:hypothetical protein